MKLLYSITILLLSCFCYAPFAVGAKSPGYLRTVPAKMLLRNRVVAPVIRPAVEEQYIMADEWIFAASLRYEYDAAGRPVRIVTDDSGSVSTVEIAYNEYGNEASRLETTGEDQEPVSKRSYAYDPVVHNYCIERMGYDWQGGQWIPNYYCERNEVNRDASGNVTEIVKTLPLGSGEMVPAYRTVWGYGADGKAVSYSYYVNESGKDINWSLYDDVEYRDIAWDRTDGQLLGDLMDMVEGPNRFLSATAYYEGEKDGYVLVSYPAGDAEGFRISYTANDPDEIGMVQKLEMIEGELSGFSYSVEQYFDDETEELTSEPVYILENVYLKDKNGNPVSDFIYEQFAGEDKELVAGIRYENTYNDDGNLIEVIQSEYDYDEGDYLPIIRTVYGEYFDVTSVTELAQVSGKLRILDGVAYSEGEIKVYTTEGILVASGDKEVSLRSLAKGLYVVSSGNNALKIKL